MKNQNIKTITFVLIALVGGLGLGYILFGGNSKQLNNQTIEQSNNDIYTFSFRV